MIRSLLIIKITIPMIYIILNEFGLKIKFRKKETLLLVQID